ncbi:MAG: EAL domain-containing protein, partial [Alphaproteobacteria bacterium]
SASRFMPGKTPAPEPPKPAGPKAAGPKPAGPKSAGKDNWPAPEPGRAPARANGTVYGLDEKEVLDIVREGLRKDRVDLYLQPIVSLPQRKTRFYECFSRIRAENGTVIRPDQYIDLAKGEGLMGAIDNMLLFRCVQLVRNAQTHSKNVGYFCNISANTLMDRKFFTDFVGFMAANEGLARNLIFEFSQTDLDTHREEIGEYAARLGQFGFNFSLDRVEDLTKLNLEILAALGFRYIKIDARKFLEMPREKDQPAMAEGAGEAELEPVLEADTVVGIDIALLKRTMDLHGIDLIVEKLEKEQNLVELLEYRIDFGQGYLFGEPRLSD